MIIRLVPLAILLIFSASCSNQMAFSTIPFTGNGSLTLGRLLINKGAPMTNESSVSLSITARGWKQMYITNDSTCSEGGLWQNFSSNVSSWNLGSLNTESAVYVKFSGIDPDPASDETIESRCVTDSILHDNRPPIVSFLLRPDIKTNKVLAKFLVGAVDNLSGVRELLCSFNDQEFEICSIESIFEELADGNYGFKFKAVDAAGNSSEVLSHSWRLDNTKPVVQWSEAPDEFIGPRANSFFKYLATDNNIIEKAKCSMNGSDFDICPEPLDYGRLKEGSHELKMMVMDDFKNESIEITHKWTVDKTAPLINVISAPADHKDNIDSIFSFSVSDSLSGIDSVNCYLNGDIQGSCSSGSYINSDIPEGHHQFKVIAIDKVGNASEVTHHWTITRTYNEIQYPVNVDESYNDADILFVIDNSSSMRKEQRNMAERLSNFLSHLVEIDWQIGVTSTDPSDRLKGNGRLVEIDRNNYVLDPSYSFAEAQQLLGQAVQMGDDGSYREQGIKAVFDSINRSLDLRDPNSRLHRDDAAFSVILISDEDEADDDFDNIPVNLINHVRSTWGEAKRFSFHSIITRPGDESCKDQWEHEYGFVYNEMSLLTDGIIGSVCEEDYSSQLSAIGEKVKDDVRTYLLPCEPVAKLGEDRPVISLELENGGQMPDYVLEGKKIIFAKDLPVGDHTIKFSCLKAY